MRTIHKYTLNADTTRTIGGGAPRVIHVGVDPSGSEELPTVWVELDPDDTGHPENDITLTFIGTGQPIPDNAAPVGSVVMPVGLVWHVYELLPAPVDPTQPAPVNPALLEG